MSQGEVLQTSPTHSVNFGMRNGSFVIGYLTPEQIRDTHNPFQVGHSWWTYLPQLMNGQGNYSSWLVSLA